MYNNKRDQFTASLQVSDMPYNNGTNRIARRQYGEPPVSDGSGALPEGAGISRRKCDGTLREPTSNGTHGTGWGLIEHPLASVYSPYQFWRGMYTPDVALERGTMFSELDLPFEVGNIRGGC